MNKDIIRSIDIAATPETVWKVLVSPSCISAYLPGAQAHTDWKVGREITFEHEGRSPKAQDKGTILLFQPYELLLYTYWTPDSSLEDSLENYITVAFNITAISSKTELTLTEVNFKTEKWYNEALLNADFILLKIKQLSEDSLIPCL